MNVRSLGRQVFMGAVTMVAAWTFLPTQAQAAEPGEELFVSKTCSGCHTIGGGKLVGPDLAGAQDRHSEEWLMNFIKGSQAMVKAGDPEAVKLFEEFNKMAMPDIVATDEEVKQIIAYIASKGGGGGGGGGAVPAPAIVIEATPANVAAGRDLFQGSTRLANGGPACNSCHDVKNDAVIGGGVLAKELTSVFSSMGAPGVQAILGKPPFPVMAKAYESDPLTDDEIAALVAFLQDADAKQELQQPRDYGAQLVISGVVGVILLLGVYTAIWRRRRKGGSVNQAIYDRQVQSQ